MRSGCGVSFVEEGWLSCLIKSSSSCRLAISQGAQARESCGAQGKLAAWMTYGNEIAGYRQHNAFRAEDETETKIDLHPRVQGYVLSTYTWFPDLATVCPSLSTPGDVAPTSKRCPEACSTVIGARLSRKRLCSCAFAWVFESVGRPFCFVYSKLSETKYS